MEVSSCQGTRRAGAGCGAAAAWVREDYVARNRRMRGRVSSLAARSPPLGRRREEGI